MRRTVVSGSLAALVVLIWPATVLAATDPGLRTAKSFAVLSGTPTFNGPIGILFSNDQAGVGLQGGFFNAIGGTAITAYSRTGVELGTVTNSTLGIQFLGLITDDGTAQIAGLLFHLVGPEPAGFAIDNVRFGLAGQVDVPGGSAVPEPASMMLLGTGLLGLVLRSRRRTAKQ